MDETYVRVKGKWQYLYRAVDKYGNTLDFMLSERRNTAGIRVINKILKRFGCPVSVQIIQSKYLNNLIEQDHRFIKRRVRNVGGFGTFPGAAATLAGIEVTNMIRKRQFENSSRSGFRQFAEIAG